MCMYLSQFRLLAMLGLHENWVTCNHVTLTLTVCQVCGLEYELCLLGWT